MWPRHYIYFKNKIKYSNFNDFIYKIFNYIYNQMLYKKVIKKINKNNNF